MPLRHRIIETRAGFAGYVATDAGLRRVYLPEATREKTLRAICADFKETVADARLLSDFAQQLTRYFSGQPVDFDVPLDVGDTTPFRKKIWAACQKVRYGQTASYQDLAARAGNPRAARAVGTAMRQNPCPLVIPCHRIIATGGGLGGYSGSCGVEFKRQLLEMERAALAGVVA